MLATSVENDMKLHLLLPTDLVQLCLYTQGLNCRNKSELPHSLVIHTITSCDIIWLIYGIYNSGKQNRWMGLHSKIKMLIIPTLNTTKRSLFHLHGYSRSGTSTCIYKVCSLLHHSNWNQFHLILQSLSSTASERITLFSSCLESTSNRLVSYFTDKVIASSTTSKVLKWVSITVKEATPNDANIRNPGLIPASYLKLPKMVLLFILFSK